MTFSVNHEWDESGECAISVSEDPPSWAWRWSDIVGIFFSTIAGYFGITSQGIQAVAKECMAAAEHSRRLEALAQEAYEQEVARAEMAGAYEGMVLYGLSDQEVDGV